MTDANTPDLLARFEADLRGREFRRLHMATGKPHRTDYRVGGKFPTPHDTADGREWWCERLGISSTYQGKDSRGRQWMALVELDWDVEVQKSSKALSETAAVIAAAEAWEAKE